MRITCLQKDVNDTSSTNLEAGLEDAARQFTSCATCLSANLNDTENRLILITDAEPNMGDFSTEGLLARFKSLSDKNVFTTFIGGWLQADGRCGRELPPVCGLHVAAAAFTLQVWASTSAPSSSRESARLRAQTTTRCTRQVG